MGNKAPSEANGEVCVTCGTYLQPCKSFDDLSQTTIEGRPVYVYNSGQYYRWRGWDDHYQCRSCFFNEINERKEQQKREEQKRREEQQRREEERRRAEEERRREEQQKEREERERREQEARREQANQNAEKLEKEANEWHMQNSNQSINQDTQQKIMNEFNMESGGEDEESDYSNSRGFDQFYNLFYNIYSYELDYIDLEDLTPENVKDFIEPLEEFIRTNWLDTSPPNKDLVTTVQIFSIKLLMAILKIPPTNELTLENAINFMVLKINESAQSLDELIHFTLSLLSAVKSNKESVVLSESLSNLCLSLEEKDKYITPAKYISNVDAALLDLTENLLLTALRIFPESKSNPVIARISSMMVAQSVVDFEYHDCSLKESFTELVRNEKWDAKSVWIVLRGILQQCQSIKDEIMHYCETFHLIGTYSIGPKQIINGTDTLIGLTTTATPETLANEVRSFTNRTKDQLKDLNELLEEIHETKLVQSDTLESVRTIISNTKTKLQKYGYPGKKNAELDNLFNPNIPEFDGWLQNLKDSNNDDLTESLTYLSCAVSKVNGWWPRDAQLISCCILMLSKDNGRLLEMGTGEGKSCVVAMFAVWLALRKKFVDIVTSSPILAARDAKEWIEFYNVFSLQVSNNVNKKDDKERKQCYQANIVYGTVTNFASDILRQEFHMKDIRPSRRFDAVIIDEVDSLLLDQGVQLTYLSHETPGLQHLNPVLSMVWCSVSQFTPLPWGTGVMWCAPPQPFFKAMYDAIDPSVCGVTEPWQLLSMGETHGLFPEGFSDKYEEAPMKVTKENEQSESKEELLEKITPDTIIKFYKAAEEYLPCNFILYALDMEGNITKLDRPEVEGANERVDVSILVAGPGICCILSDSEEELREPIEEQVKHLVLQSEEAAKTEDLMAHLPKFLRSFIEKRLSIWVENAFYALKMQEGREYLVKGDNILPIDYRSTGIVQLNKKWSNGLHQFLQMKHKLNLNPLSVVTNFLSNITFFKRYQQSLFGMTGTLGNKTDHDFLTATYDLKLCEIPTFSAKKLFEYDGVLAANKSAWENSIVESLKDKIAPKTWKGKGRAALIICEDINSAKELSILIKEKVGKNVKLYIRNDTDQLNIIRHKLEPMEIVVATNLAGRGTNVKVKGEVKDSGGLFVLVTFLPQNARVERQAFGRTARKGDPGSCQIIANSETLPGYLADAHSIPNATYLRDIHARRNLRQGGFKDVELKEKLFTEYCKLLQFFHTLNVGNDMKKMYATTLNEYWGMWLLRNQDKFEDTPESELIILLNKEVSTARDQIYNLKSATQNIYPLIRFGNEVLLYPEANSAYSAYDLYTQAITVDPDWAAIAYYNRVYCRIQNGGSKEESIEDLKKALDSIKKLKELDLIALQLVNSAKSYVSKTAEEDEESPLSMQMNTKFQIMNFFEKNIQEAIDKLNEFKDDDVEAEEKSVFSLITDSDSRIHAELYILWQNGLINVYSIKKKPRFCWEGLIVFILGALQVVAGIALMVLSAGTLANIGMGLVGEGISDMIDGVIGMATGDFSWEGWAISKAIGIATSLIGFGVGKILSKGFKAFKMAAKGLTKELKALPKLAKSQIKGGLTQVTKENMKNAAKYAGKEFVEEGVLRGLQYAEDIVVDEFMDLVKEAIEGSIENIVHKSVFEEELGATMDQLVLQQIGGTENSSVLTEESGPKNSLVKTILDFGSKVLDSHMKDLAWQNQLNSFLQGTMESVKQRVAKEGKKNKFKAMFEIAEMIHMGALLIDTVDSVTALINEFNVEYVESIETFMEKSGSTQYDRSRPVQNNSDFTQLKTDIVKSLTRLLSEAIVTLVDQKFTSHIVRKGEKLMNGKISKYVGDKFLENEIEDKLKAGQASVAISAMPTHSDLSISSIRARDYADDIKDSKTPGSILDLRILSEKLNVKVSLLEVDGESKYRKMLNIVPDSANDETPKVQLIYRTASDEYPDGHYDVLKNGKILQVDNENKNCAFHALSKALYPNNTEEENRKKATELRSQEAEELVSNSGRWNNFVRMKEQVQSLSSAMWYLGIGGAKKKTKKRKIDDDNSATPTEVAEVAKVRKFYPGDVDANLQVAFQIAARDRWAAIVVENPAGDNSKYSQIQMKYQDASGAKLTNQELFQTLAFYHERGAKDPKGELKPLRVEMNIGGTNHYFKMSKAAQGTKQIIIDTLNDDFPNTSAATKSYKDVAKNLDSVDGKPDPKVITDPTTYNAKLDAFKKQEKVVRKVRAKMIHDAITKDALNQPDFNRTYKSDGDGQSYPYFDKQQKRSVVSLIAITQVAESCPPDYKFKMMLEHNAKAKKTPEQLKEEVRIAKNALKNLSEFPGGTPALRDEAIAERVKIFKDALSNDKLPSFNETFTSKSDGKTYNCFDAKQTEAGKLYFEVKKINEYETVKDINGSDLTKANKAKLDLEQSILDDLKREKKKKRIFVEKTGRLPGTDSYALRLLELMSKSDFDFTTTFAKKEEGTTDWLPLYPPVYSADNAREDFYNS